MLGVIIARSGGIFDRTVVGHLQLSGYWQAPAHAGLAQLPAQGNGRSGLEAGDARGSKALASFIFASGKKSLQRRFCARGGAIDTIDNLEIARDSRGRNDDADSEHAR